MRTSSLLVLLFLTFVWLPLAVADDSNQPKDATSTVAPGLARSASPDRMARLVPLKHADAAAIRQALATLCPLRAGPAAQSGVTVEALGDGVILCGQSEAIDLAMASIAILDAENARNLETRFISPKAVLVEAIEPVLRNVFEQAYRARSKGEMPGVITDPRTQMLIVTATPRDMQLVNEILGKLDVQVPSGLTPEECLRARVEVTAFEVLVPRNQIAGMEMTKLAESARTIQSLEDSLAAMGKTRILYRADEAVLMALGTKLSLKSQTPFVRGTQVSNAGQITTQVEYEKVGCEVKLEGLWEAVSSDEGKAKVDIEMSVIGESVIDLGNDHPAPVFRSVSQHFAGAIKSAQPVILLDVDAAGSGDVATAYVTRLVLRHMR